MFLCDFVLLACGSGWFVGCVLEMFLCVGYTCVCGLFMVVCMNNLRFGECLLMCTILGGFGCFVGWFVADVLVGFDFRLVCTLLCLGVLSLF